MNRLLQRLGVLPSLILGAALFFIGLYTFNFIVNNWWPIDVHRLDLVRATANDTAVATALLDAANIDIVLAFLGTILVAVTGLALPLAYVLNKRFNNFLLSDMAAARGRPSFFVTLRQAMAVGFWVAVCVWLQMNRVLGVAVALLVAVVLILFEILIQVRTRATQLS